MRERLKKIAKGAGIAVAGALTSYLVAVDWSDFGPIYAAVASAVLNSLYQLLRPVS